MAETLANLPHRLHEFVAYAKTLKGDEKGEAQVFCDRLFKGFGHSGYKEAGATLEFRIKKHSKRGTSFADLVWKPRLLLEMKRAGEKLYSHYKQAFEYWLHAVPDRPRYVVLCNFREFWVYDFDKQLDQPVDVVTLDELPKRYSALNFLLPHNPPPIFGNDREAVSREAADKVAQVFGSLLARGIPRVTAQRFVLQMVVAMFAEDIDLLPASTIFQLVRDCVEHGQSSYDLFGGLFSQMNTATPASGGRYKGVRYFNGGVFQSVEAIELTVKELDLVGGVEGAATKDWSKVNPAIFGTLFQHSMDAAERHAFGAHFTSEADIQRVVGPTIVRPWQNQIANASSMKELFDLRRDLLAYRVLDPACGSGNFLYVAYRELVRLEIQLLTKLRHSISAKEFEKRVKSVGMISPKQFFGIDRDSFGVELAKVTLMLAKKLALDEAVEALERDQIELGLGAEDDPLPLDNLDSNFVCGDALFLSWPKVDSIVGNPPYQSKNKIQKELGRAYVNSVRKEFPDIDGRADYCVYWFRRAHDHLRDGQRAGLVGTNTIRQNYSRIGGLDHIVARGGTITEAVSSMPWSGDAVVHVSVVNWIKGKQAGKKRLFIHKGAKPPEGWSVAELDTIGPSLSFGTDVTTAVALKANSARGLCFQGQTHGHEAFLLSIDQAHAAIRQDPTAKGVLFPYLVADELIGRKDGLPTRYVIDFWPKTLLEAQAFGTLFERIENEVLPARKAAAEKEKERNEEALEADPHAEVAHHHANFLNRWWLLSYPREDMLKAIQQLRRYVVCGRVTMRPIFEFIDSGIRPNDALMVFPFEDDYSFGLLQSGVHWLWFKERCSTLKSDYRYTSNTVFDSFPWPQTPSTKAVEGVARTGTALRALRTKLRTQHGLSLRELYRTIELPGSHPLKEAHEQLDDAVKAAYGMSKSSDVLSFLLTLNQELAQREKVREKIVGPGLPATIKTSADFIGGDSIRMI